MHDNHIPGRGNIFADRTPISREQRFAEIADVIKRQFQYRSDVSGVFVNTNQKRITIGYEDDRLVTLIVK